MAMAKNQDNEIEFVEALARILLEKGLTEIRYARTRGEFDNISLRLSNKATELSERAARTGGGAKELATVSQEFAEQPADTSGITRDPEGHPGVVTAPMVGTVYLQPEPDAAQFVEIGRTVAKGDTVVIIEAMKTMNHIPAPVAGVVSRIMVENRSIVEYGAPMLIIE